MGRKELDPPPLPEPTGNIEVDKYNRMLYQKNREIYTRMTGKIAPRPNLSEPPSPPYTGDPEVDRRYRDFYITLCLYYQGLTGNYPEDFVPPISG